MSNETSKAIALGILLLLLCATNVMAGSTWTETSTDFASGTLSDTVITNGKVGLAINSSAATSWTNKSVSGPSARHRFAMAHDSNNGVSVIFGGYDGSPYKSDTWAYNLSANLWTSKNPVASPSIRYEVRMAFDSVNGVFVLFGGAGNGNPWYKNDTWTYNVSNNTWTLKNPATAPTGRGVHSMTFDSANGVVVLFGGTSGGNETWVYNTTLNSWTNRMPVNPPSARTMSSICYDSANGVVVLFGGSTGSGETWLYNVSNNTWMQKTPSPAPTGRFGHAMEYDSSNGVAVLFGGNPINNETWTYNVSSNSWTNVTVTKAPSPRTTHGMVCDRSGQSMVLFGGSPDGSATLGDTWTFGGPTGYLTAGTYTSRQFDTGGNTNFGNLEWTASTTANTAVKIQLRTAINASDLPAKNFVGPDGAAGAFYTQSATKIFSGHDGDRYVQYRAYLGSSKLSETPELVNVTVGYNRVHSVSVTSPAANQNITGKFNITWTASDPDGDTLSFDIYIVSGLQNIPLISGLSGTTTRLEWNTSIVANGSYRIRIQSRDNNAGISNCVNATSGLFTIFHPAPPDRLPRASLISPGDGAVFNVTSVQLSWNGSDDDGDLMMYHVILANSSFDPLTPPEAVCVTDTTTHLANDLQDGVKYYWTVIPDDGTQNGTAPPVRTFSIKLNHAPSAVLASPANNSAVNSTSAQLAWSASDPDDDAMEYLVFISSGPLSLKSLPAPVARLSGRAYIATNLTNGTTYNWTVIPSDGRLNGTPNAVWQFTVDVSLGNHLPAIVSLPVLKATTGIPYLYYMAATDPDGDTLSFTIPTFPDGMTVNNTSGTISWVPKPAQKGNITVVARVTDPKGGYAQQGFVIQVAGPAISPLPKCNVTNPPSGKTVSKTVTITGTASGSALTGVEVRVDSGNWTPVDGRENWTFRLDTTKLPDGTHWVGFRAAESGNYSELTQFQIVVSNPGKPSNDGEQFPSWIIGGVAAIGVAAGAGALMVRRKGRGGSGQNAPVQQFQTHYQQPPAQYAPAPPGNYDPPYQQPPAQYTPPAPQEPYPQSPPYQQSPRQQYEQGPPPPPQ